MVSAWFSICEDLRLSLLFGFREMDSLSIFSLTACLFWYYIYYLFSQIMYYYILELENVYRIKWKHSLLLEETHGMTGFGGKK